MDYDPVKDRLGAIFQSTPALQKTFYAILHLVFLRAWYVKREVRNVLALEPRPRILDAGTGFGQYAWFMATEWPGSQIVAVDIKQDYLDKARDFFDRTPYARNITFEWQDLTDLKTDGPFDLITSVDVMEHIEDDRAVFRHFARVLRTGGHVIINTPSDLGGSDAHGDEASSFIGEHVRNGYNRQELEGKLRDAGLEPVRTLYTYGKFGSMAWRLLIKTPIQMLNRSKAALLLLPFYYLPVMPVGLLLNAMDLRKPNRAGTGILVVARKKA